MDQHSRPFGGLRTCDETLLHLRFAQGGSLYHRHAELDAGQPYVVAQQQQPGLRHACREEGEERRCGGGLPAVQRHGVVERLSRLARRKRKTLEHRRQHVGSRRHLEREDAEVVHVLKHQRPYLELKHHPADQRQHHGPLPLSRACRHLGFQRGIEHQFQEHRPGTGTGHTDIASQPIQRWQWMGTPLASHHRPCSLLRRGRQAVAGLRFVERRHLDVAAERGERTARL